MNNLINSNQNSNQNSENNCPWESPAACCIGIIEIAKLIIHYADLGRYAFALTSKLWKNYIETYNKDNSLSIEIKCGIKLFGGYRKFVSAYLTYVCENNKNKKSNKNSNKNNKNNNKNKNIREDMLSVFFPAACDPTMPKVFDEMYVLGILCSKLNTTEKYTTIRTVADSIYFVHRNVLLSLLLNISTDIIIDFFSLFDKLFQTKLSASDRDNIKIIISTNFLNNSSTKKVVLEKLVKISTNIWFFPIEGLLINLIRLGLCDDVVLWLKIALRLHMYDLNECLAAAIKYERPKCFNYLLGTHPELNDLEFCLSGTIIEYIGDGNAYKKYSYLPSCITKCHNIQIVQTYLNWVVEHDCNYNANRLHIHYLNLLVRHGCIDELNFYKDFNAKVGFIGEFPPDKHNKMFIKLANTLIDACIPIYNYECLEYLLTSDIFCDNYFYVTSNSPDCIKIINKLFSFDNNIVVDSITFAIDSNNMEYLQLLSTKFDLTDIDHKSFYHKRLSATYFELLVDQSTNSDKLLDILNKEYPWYRLPNKKIDRYVKILNVVRPALKEEIFVTKIVDLLKFKSSFGEESFEKIIDVLESFYREIPQTLIISLLEKFLFIESLSFDSFVNILQRIMNIYPTLIVYLISSAIISGKVKYVEYLLIKYPLNDTSGKDLVFIVLDKLFEISSSDHIRTIENYFDYELEIKEIINCLQYVLNSIFIKMSSELDFAFKLAKNSLIKLCEYYCDNFILVDKYRCGALPSVITPSWFWFCSYSTLKHGFKQKIKLLKRTNLIANSYRPDQAIIYTYHVKCIPNDEEDCSISEFKEPSSSFEDSYEEVSESFLTKYYVDKNKRKKNYLCFSKKKIDTSLF